MRVLTIAPKKQTKKSRFRIKGVAQTSANEQKFTDEKGKEWTVAQYFQKTYFKLKYPDLPLLTSGGNKTTYFPMEVCFVSSAQRVTRLLSDFQVGGQEGQGSRVWVPVRTALARMLGAD